MQEKGFFGRLFDLSFNEFVTTSIIKVLYVIAIIVAAVVGLFVMFSLFMGGFRGVLMGLILGPVVFVVYVILARVWLEVLIVIFRIAENTAKIAGVKEPPQVQ